MTLITTILMLFLTFLQSSKEQSELKHMHIEEKETDLGNWTSCEEFLGNSTLDIDRIVDVDWKIFYFWHPEEEYTSYNVRFSKATPILTDRFKVELNYANSTVDWDSAVLFMETTDRFSALYISTDVPGIFRLIPSFAFHADYIPVMIFALKLVEPGYLGIVNCEYRFCYALAPEGKMPRSHELKSAAESIGFVGEHNRSYLYKPKPPSLVPPITPDDEDDDEAFEIATGLDLED